MDAFLLAGRLILALVFVVAGLMKVADLPASTKALRGLGVPGLLARTLAIVLPPTEIAIALALLSSTVAWWGAAASLSVLLIFIAVISINVARGRVVSCRCFGQLSNDAIGLPTLLRNQMLASIAVLLLWQGWTNMGPGVVSWFAQLTISGRIKLTVGLVLLGIFAARKQILSFLRRGNIPVGHWTSSLQGRLPLTAGTATRVLHTNGFTGMFPAAGLPVGTVIPNLQVTNGEQRKIKLHSLLDQTKPLLLVFIDHDCDPCRSLLSEINYWRSNYADKLNISVITRSDEVEVAEAFNLLGFPTGVLLGGDGLVASRSAFGAEAIRSLMADTVHLSDARPHSRATSACGSCGG